MIVANPLARLAVGTPLYTLYLRALGARIGRGAVIFTTHVPVCTDLLTIGAGTVIRKDVYLSGYRARAGVIETGPVTLGAGRLRRRAHGPRHRHRARRRRAARARVRPARRAVGPGRRVLARLARPSPPRPAATTGRSRPPAAARCAGPGTASPGCCSLLAVAGPVEAAVAACWCHALAAAPAEPDGRSAPAAGRTDRRAGRLTCRGAGRRRGRVPRRDPRRADHRRHRAPRCSAALLRPGRSTRCTVSTTRSSAPSPG